jgi:hypothetical protein
VLAATTIEGMTATMMNQECGMMTDEDVIVVDLGEDAATTSEVMVALHQMRGWPCCSHIGQWRGCTTSTRKGDGCAKGVVEQSRVSWLGREAIRLNMSNEPHFLYSLSP